ncbi:MAG TPA: Crp/Fnr family transcriptional regulator [Chromatiales bacterium]|nr:Crp/Fnr family transcriptional regulator [Thiotrichales bacterium]HIP66995.1 Crp/Fnr family transcriptional regulator [Chromatiales bacterium]
MNYQFQIKTEALSSCEHCEVRQLAFFKPIKEDLLEWESQFRSTQYHVAPKQLLYREGDVPEEVYTLHEGWVLIYKTLEDGKRQVLRIALPGDFLGYHADLDAPIDHAAVAVNRCTLCAFPRKTVKEMITSQPELAIRLLEIQSQTMHECNNHMASIGQKSAIQRVASLFFELYRKMDARHGVVDNSIEFPLTQDDIADAIGVTPVHVSRVAKELREKQIVDCGHGRMNLYDMDALAKVAGIKI